MNKLSIQAMAFLMFGLLSNANVFGGFLSGPLNLAEDVVDSSVGLAEDVVDGSVATTEEVVGGPVVYQRGPGRFQQGVVYYE